MLHCQLTVKIFIVLSCYCYVLVLVLGSQKNPEVLIDSHVDAIFNLRAVLELAASCINHLGAVMILQLKNLNIIMMLVPVKSSSASDSLLLLVGIKLFEKVIIWSVLNSAKIDKKYDKGVEYGLAVDINLVLWIVVQCGPSSEQQQCCCVLLCLQF